MSKNNRKVAVGAVIAAAAGYVAGILTAPKSGKETRKDIQTATLKAKSEAEKKLKELHSELGDLIDQGKSKAKDVQTTAKVELADALTKAQHVKDKAKNVLSAVHEGDAADTDLKKAVHDAKTAVEHLKTYLKKDISK